MRNIINTGKELTGFQTSTQIYGNHKVILSCCKRILEYSDVYIRTDCGSIIIEIWGNNLSVDDCGTEGITAHGTITSVSFIQKNGVQ